ncbi:unnamed protein product [Calypogeia fissa]
MCGIVVAGGRSSNLVGGPVCNLTIVNNSRISTISTISPRLFLVEKLLATSSSFSSFSSSGAVTFPYQTDLSIPHICFPLCPSFSVQKPSASHHHHHHTPTFSSWSSPSPSANPCFSVSFSTSLSARCSARCSAPISASISASFSAPFSAPCSASSSDRCSASFAGSSQLGGSLMSSRLAPAYSSFCGLTRLEGLIRFEGFTISNSRSGSRRSSYRRGSKGELALPRHIGDAKAFVEIRAFSSALGDQWCGWREGRGSGGGKLKSRCMETERNVQRIECYSSSSSQSTAGGGGGDQPVSSSVLPPIPANPIPTVSKVKGMAISFCPRCGGATEEKIPVGEHEKRYVCTACGAVHYQNPKMVVGCLVEYEGKILLCRRNIEPSFGLWTLPAGYMEMGESAAEGAARETLEEACAQVQVLALFAHIDIPLIGQSHIYFRAQMKDPHFAPGPESIECALFELNEIPFDSLAFSSIQVALKMYIEDTKAGKMRVHHAVIDKRPGAGPSDLKGFVVRDVLTS